mgnify:CR=1 FL=1
MKIMKKNIITKLVAAVVLMAAAALVSGCSNADNGLLWSDVPTIQGAQNHAAVLELGSTLQLSATTTDGKAVVWESSDERVATVDQTGLVTPVALGEAVITAYPKEYETIGNGNYVVVTVVDTKVGFVDDQIDQSEAE